VTQVQKISRPEQRLHWYAAYEEFLDAAVGLVGSPVEPLKAPAQP